VRALGKSADPLTNPPIQRELARRGGYVLGMLYLRITNLRRQE
jgi:hypothetical protein